MPRRHANVQHAIWPTCGPYYWPRVKHSANYTNAENYLAVGDLVTQQQPYGLPHTRAAF